MSVMSANVFNFDTMADLRLATTTAFANGSIAIIDGYYNKYDKGGGTYRYESSATDTPNDGTIVAVNNKYTNGSGYNGSGRWFLLHNGVVNVRQFGALGDGSGDTIADNPGSRFVDSDKLRQAKVLYPGAIGEPFNGLIDTDTIDWCAIQAAIKWCMVAGARLEVPAGVYMCRRPVWIGDDATITTPESNKDSRYYGFTMVGQVGNSRSQADGGVQQPSGGVANIRLTQDCTNRYCLSMNSTPVGSPEFQLWFVYPEATYMVTGLDTSMSASAIVAAIDAVLPSDYTVSADPSSSAHLDSQNVYFQIKSTSMPIGFLGEVEVRDEATTGDPPVHPLVNYVRCLPDCAILSFRRSAGLFYRVENLTLKGDATNEEGDDNVRNASFGVLFATSQFVGHIVERVRVSFADTVVGLLQGTGSNGEQTRMSRIYASDCKRGYFSNAPQAFACEFDGWNLELSPNSETDEDPQIYAEFAQMPSPGVGVNFINAHATFGGVGNTEGNGTLVKIRRGTGIVQFTGGRMEHLRCLFDYDAIDGQGANCNLDLIVRGLEFAGVRGGFEAEHPERVFIYGSDEGGSPGSNYGLTVQDCAFQIKDGLSASNSSLFFTSKPIDNIRCTFERCRFIGVQGFQVQNFHADFVRCFKNDFQEAGATAYDLPLRQFTQTVGVPTNRTQSIRTIVQDTPHVQSGPRFNLLMASDFVGQDLESSDDHSLVTLQTTLGIYLYPWVSWNGESEGEIVFARWGKFADSNIDMSPAAFFLGLQGGQMLTNDVQAFDLDGTETKILTYQCLCQIKGNVRFAIVNGDTPDDTVYDEVVINSPGAYCDLTQVTLRAQLAAPGGTEIYFRLVIENLDPTNGSDHYARIKVLTQQAWGGKEGNTTYPLNNALPNATFAFTDDGAAYQSTYPWSVNSLSVRAQSRLQIPAKPSRFGWEQQGMIGNAVSDLRNGDVYYDLDQKALLMVMNNDELFVISQPERLSTRTSSFTWRPEDHPEKSSLFVPAAGSSDRVVTLEDDVQKVPNGTVSRIYCRSDVTGYAVKVRFGTSGTQHPIDAGNMGEYVFVGGAWISIIQNQPFVM